MSTTEASTRRPLAALGAGLGAGLTVLTVGLLGFGQPDRLAVAAVPAVSTTLVINELDYRQPGAQGDRAEFVELKNVGSVDIDLINYDLVGVDGQGIVYRRDDVATASFTLAAGARYVVCGDSAYVPGCQRNLKVVDAWRGGSGTGAFAIALLRTGRADVIVDTVAYEGRVGNGPNGEVWMEGVQVSPADNDKDANLGIGRFSFLNGFDGGDSDNNSNDFGKSCITPGQSNGTNQPPCAPPPTNTPAPTRTPTPTATSTTTPTITDTPKPTLTPTEAPPDVLTLIVNTDTNDKDGRCDGRQRCSLRRALEEVNASMHNGPIVIRFAQPMEIRVPDNDPLGPLPALTRGNVTLTGVGAKPALLAAGTGPRAVPPAVWIHGPGAGTSMIGIELNDTRNAVVQGLQITGFRVGILVHGGGSRNTLGVVPDGIGDEAEGNLIHANTEADIRVTESNQNVIAGNQIGFGPIGGDVAAEVGVDLLDAHETLVGRFTNQLGARGSPNRIQWRHKYGVRIAGSQSERNVVAGNLLGAGQASDDPDVGNAVGLLLADSVFDNNIGTDNDGNGDKEEPNLIAYNLDDGIQVGATAVNNTIRGNVIRNNRRFGIGLQRTVRRGNWMTANRITGNGGAAIAFAGDGYEPPVPSIDSISDLGMGQWRVKGSACDRCTVEVFADPGDEARLFLGAASVDGGSWFLDIPDVTGGGDVNLAATAHGDGTSRLSPAQPIDPATMWFLHAVPPDGPRAIGRGQNLDRRYRLWNELRQPEPRAEIRFTPIGLSAFTDNDGYVDIVVPLDRAADYFNRGISFTVEAVSNRDGRVHPIGWHPVMAMARERPKDDSGIILDMTGLGSTGMGGLLRRGSSNLASGGRPQPAPAVSRTAARLTNPAPRFLARPVAAPALDEDAFGAAWTAADVEEFREGQFAWQENMARGGALYELKPGSKTLEGELEINAPVTAWNAAGKVSGCPGAGDGGIMAAWNRGKICWVPVPGSSVSAPQGGSPIFTVRANVKIPPAGSTLFGLLQSTQVYTLYTVGFDVTAPVITPTIATGAVLSALPPVLADAVDGHAGIDADDGVSVTLGGQPIVVQYDAKNRRIVVPDGSRPIPPGLQGPSTLVIRVTDGFCNRTELSLPVRLDPSIPPTETPTPTLTPIPTATWTPTATRTVTVTAMPSPSDTPRPTATGATPDPRPDKIYLPFAHQRLLVRR
jgi:hypothetical protein